MPPEVAYEDIGVFGIVVDCEVFSHIVDDDFSAFFFFGFNAELGGDVEEKVKCGLLLHILCFLLFFLIGFFVENSHSCAVC